MGKKSKIILPKDLDQQVEQFRTGQDAPVDMFAPHRFHCNSECQYFPCHNTGMDLKQFNCMFCYCPLYPMLDCGGSYGIVEHGNYKMKDCSACIIPHTPQGYDYIQRKIAEQFDDNDHDLIRISNIRTIDELIDDLFGYRSSASYEFMQTLLDDPEAVNRATESMEKIEHHVTNFTNKMMGLQENLIHLTDYLSRLDLEKLQLRFINLFSMDIIRPKNLDPVINVHQFINLDVLTYKLLEGKMFHALVDVLFCGDNETIEKIHTLVYELSHKPDPFEPEDYK